MNKDNINTVVHRMINEIIKPDSICIDATCGNGNDTFFLAERSRHVYAFDIQEEAILNSKDKTKNFNNITYINDSHSVMDNYIKENVDLIVFNLGYLPKSTSKIITNYKTTIIALEKSYELLRKNGYVFISVYLGHDDGNEYREVNNWIKSSKFYVDYTYQQDKENAPILFVLKKI